MKLKRFIGVGIHGYLNLDIKFHSALTFLTGINGSGKTSALNAIVALISPDLRILATLEYQSLSLQFSHDNVEHSITASFDGKIVTLTILPSKDVFTYGKYIPDSDMSSSRQIDLETQHYKDLVSANPDIVVLRVIQTLPTPMFLGLDRRARYEEEISKRPRYLITRSSIKAPRNLFAGSLANSLFEAEYLAETKYRDALIQSGRKAEQLQGELFLSLLSEERVDQHPYGSISVPDDNDLRDLAAARRDLEALPQILRLSPKEVRARVIPFLDNLQRFASIIPRDIDVSKLLSQDTSNSEVFAALFGWSANQGRLKKFKVISNIVSRYNREKSEIMRPSGNYSALINSFLGDSGKEVKFGEDGRLHFRCLRRRSRRTPNFLSFVRGSSNFRNINSSCL